jgi:hypothetical protein
MVVQRRMANAERANGNQACGCLPAPDKEGFQRVDQADQFCDYEYESGVWDKARQLEGGIIMKVCKQGRENSRNQDPDRLHHAIPYASPASDVHRHVEEEIFYL